MAKFAYVAWNAQGKEIKGEIDGASSADALQKIRAQGFFPTSIAEARGKTAGGPAAGRKMSFSLGSGVSRKQLTLFTRQLATLQEAGLPIVRSLKTLERQVKKASRMKTILLELAESVEGGASFSEALAQYPNVFDKLFVNMVKAGEAGGVLDTILERLADFLEKSERLRRRVIGALIYPITVLIVAFIIVGGLMIFVVPQFRDLFQKLEVPLPWVTDALLNFSDFLKRHFYLPIAIPIAGWITVVAFRSTPQGRVTIDRVKLAFPGLGVIANKATISRFTRTLGTLIASGVPILEALSIVKDAAGNEVVSRAIGKIHDSIREGESIAEPLRHSGICDAMVVDMIDVGEETGELDKMLMKVADKYDEEVDVAVDALMKVFEPALIVTLGVIIGTTVIALFYPLVTMINTLSQKTGGAH